MALGEIDPVNREAQLAAAGAWTCTLETSREGRADVNAMAKGQSKAVTVSPVVGSTSQTIIVTFTDANDEPDATDDSGAASDNVGISTLDVLIFHPGYPYNLAHQSFKKKN